MSLYNYLNLDDNASKKDIKKAYYKLAKIYHPDKKTGNEEIFKKVQGAYEILSSDKLRIEYNDDDESDKLKNIFIKTHFIKIKKDDKYIEFEIKDIIFEDGNCFNNYKHKKYKCIYKIVIKDTEKLNNLLRDYTDDDTDGDDDIILQIIKYKNETSLEKLYDKNNYKIDKDLKKHFIKFLNDNNSSEDPETEKLEYDACELLKKGFKHANPIKIDQGTKDNFYSGDVNQLLTENIIAVAKDQGQELEVNFREGFDHSYWFMTSFMEDHIKFHAKYLQ